MVVQEKGGIDMKPVAMLSPITALVALRGVDDEIDVLAQKLLSQPVHVWLGAFAALSAGDRVVLSSALVNRGADPSLVRHAAGLAGLGLADDASGLGGAKPVMSLIGLAGSGAAFAHGYMRHNRSGTAGRILWGLWWSIFGLFALPLALIEGFGKPEKE